MRRSLAMLIVSSLMLLPVAAPARGGDAQEVGRALLAAGEWEGALAAFEKLVNEEPENGEAWYSLGQAAFELRRYDLAADAYGRALESGFQARRAMLEMARCHAARGAADTAVEWLRQFAAAGPGGYLTVRGVAEFQQLEGHAGFAAVVAGMRPCSATEYRQFDFWLGDWDVANASSPSRPPAHNRISSIQGGCVILEEYDTPGGYTGVSLSYYDKVTGFWSQSWMDNQGAPIIHSGGLEDGSMVLIDDSRADSVSRTTWTPLDDGRVRQHWQSSSDGGSTWTTVFDGYYSRRKADSD